MIRTRIERLVGNEALGLVLAVLLAAILLLAARPAHASNHFTVNSTADIGDSSPDGRCDHNPFFAGLQCTLREAIQEANATASANTIKFNVPGSGVKTIKPNSELPKITAPVTIDGYTQPGASPNTLAVGTNAILLIELDGENAGANGLRIDASNSLVRGLAINRFFRGIAIGGDGNRVEGNFLGTDPGGAQDLGNSQNGVLINFASDTTVGGTTPAARNLISGNGFDGVEIQGGATTGSNQVLGNLIGTKKNGTGALGNSGNGVSILGSDDNVVGGATAAAANTIAFNGGNGVDATTLSALGDVPTGNRILRNSIFSNEDLGIDLNGDGSTANDAGDSDTGPNNLQNKPVLISAVTSRGATTIEGRLNSTPSKTFNVQFFSNPSGEDEGKTFIGQKSVSTNSNGVATFTFRPARAVAVGQTITATATGPGRNTSEFSAPRAVVP